MKSKPNLQSETIRRAGCADETHLRARRVFDALVAYRDDLELELLFTEANAQESSSTDDWAAYDRLRHQLAFVQYEVESRVREHAAPASPEGSAAGKESAGAA